MSNEKICYWSNELREEIINHLADGNDGTLNDIIYLLADIDRNLSAIIKEMDKGECMVGIKEFDMPKSCMDCELNYDCCACSVTNTRFDFEKCDKERLDDCPLVEIKD